jgi:hypothetical protein
MRFASQITLPPVTSASVATRAAGSLQHQGKSFSLLAATCPLPAMSFAGRT